MPTKEEFDAQLRALGNTTAYKNSTAAQREQLIEAKLYGWGNLWAIIGQYGAMAIKEILKFIDPSPQVQGQIWKALGDMMQTMFGVSIPWAQES